MSFGEGDLHGRVLDLESQVRELKSFCGEMLAEIREEDNFFLRGYFERRARELGVEV